MNPMDPHLPAALVVYANKDLMKKLLGPAADYAGHRLENLVKKADQNVERILKAAVRRVGPDIDAPGAVPARVLKDVMLEGAFVEDELTAEYFGGILASSRTPEGRDDRGVAMLGLLKRLSTYQVRAHYIAYRMIRETSRPHEYGGGILRIPGSFRMTPDEFSAAMEFSEDERSRCTVLVEHVIFGLVREDLVTEGVYGHATPSAQHSVMGIELFNWAHGKGDSTVDSFLDPSLDYGMPVKIPGLD